MMKYLIALLVVILLVLATITFKNYRKKNYYETVELERIRATKITEDKLFDNGRSPTLPYRLFSPKILDEKLPLVLYLHGAAGRGSDNIRQLEHIARYLTSHEFQQKHKSFAVIPQCPKNHEWVDTPPTKGPLKNYNQDDIDEGIYQKSVLNLLDELVQRLPIDINRLYVIGYSMGATGTWDIITRHPEKFAAAVILSGRSDPAKAETIKSLPIWLFHGKSDPVSPISNSDKMVEQLNKVGSSIIFSRLRAKHGISHIALKEKKLFSWLFNKKKQTTSNFRNSNE